MGSALARWSLAGIVGLGLAAALAFPPAVDARRARADGRVEVVEVYERSQDFYSSSYNNYTGQYDEYRESNREFISSRTVR